MSIARRLAPVADLDRADPLLNIGTFARRSWLSMKALRLYERVGLLKPAQVDGENGYRRYRQSQLATARLIAMLRRLEMPLAQIAEVVAAAEQPRPEVMARGWPDSEPGAISGIQAGVSPHASALVAAYWDSVERQMESKRQLAAHIQIRLLGEQGTFLSMFEVQERDVPEQLVLTEQRHVYVQELKAWLPSAIGRLVHAAQTHGGAAAPVFVIYHGQVNQDSDGPVEVCVPIQRDLDVPGDLATRVEPAHREAYTRITKAQVDYPQILSAYDAVSQWMRERGRAMAAAPREIYFTVDFGAAKPTDEVCDIAFPLDAPGR